MASVRRSAPLTGGLTTHSMMDAAIVSACFPAAATAR
jgi:hypothetical protein